MQFSAGTQARTTGIIARTGGILRAEYSESGFEPLPTWQDALERYLKALKENGDL